LAKWMILRKTVLSTERFVVILNIAQRFDSAIVGIQQWFPFQVTGPPSAVYVKYIYTNYVQ
jgi:hypothetical protein